MRAFEAVGEAVLARGWCGRRLGEQKALTLCQQALIRRLIVGKCPDQLKLPFVFVLWTREAIAQLSAHKTSIRLSLSAVSLHFVAWGFTPQKPIRRATERDEAAIRTWLDHEYPAIVKRAKKEAAEIHWADEIGISSLTNRGKLRFMVL